MKHVAAQFVHNRCRGIAKTASASGGGVSTATNSSLSRCMNKQETSTDVRKLLAKAILDYGDNPTPENRRAVNTMLDNYTKIVRIEAVLDYQYQRTRW